MPPAEIRSAGATSVDNSVFIQDGLTLLDWEGSSNAERSSVVIGSYTVSAKVKTRIDSNTAIVQYTGENFTTLGSGVPLPGKDPETVQLLNSLVGDTGSFSQVSRTFIWYQTETW
jgi:hypothetical protein